MDKKVVELTNKVDSVSFCELERAKIACEELLSGYFDCTPPEACILVACHEKYATMTNIVFDYIVQAQQKLDVARKEAEA